MPRGILATVTAKLSTKDEIKTVRSKYEEFYKNAKFVNLLPIGSMPLTSSVLGTNNAQIQIAIDEHTDRLIISCAIDNLGKGAAGQAIQNANLMCGLPADSGLQLMGVR